MRFTSAELILLLPSVVLAAPQLPTIGLPSIGLPIPSEICYITTVCSTVDATSTSSKAIETSSLFDSTTLLNTTTSSPIESVTILPINITTSSAQVTISPTVISSVTGTGSASYVSTTSGLWNTTTSTTIIPESSTSDISVSTESATTTSTYIPPVSSTTGSFSTSTRTTSSGTAAPTAIEIRGLTYGGSGCSSNSVVSQLSKDKSMLTLMYGAFVAQTGPGLVPADARKNCQLNVAITYPSGWQFSIFKADYRGYANLPTGQKGVVRASYYFSGQSEQTDSNTNLLGPYDDNYIKTDTFSIDSTVWSPCGYDGMLNINSEVRINPLISPNPALMTVDSADLKFTQIHYLAWREC